MTLQVLVTNLLGCLSAVSKIDEKISLYTLRVATDRSSLVKSFGTVDKRSTCDCVEFCQLSF